LPAILCIPPCFGKVLSSSAMVSGSDVSKSSSNASACSWA
jgi:hypothetical protein